jgi:hypothetical protein
MSRKVDASYHQLGTPTQPGVFEVAGLGTVTLTERDIAEWLQNDFNGTMKLIEGGRDEWQFIGWNFERPN